MKKVNRYLWLAVMVISLPVFFFVWADEGFCGGKAYMFLLTTFLGACGFWIAELKRFFISRK
ncbi:MAG: hypothetical protein EXR21_08555 [Flavobacteriaceae bacterium]|nr:hypothetical protein [Flavobacteriaceae bacterium]